MAGTDLRRFRFWRAGYRLVITLLPASLRLRRGVEMVACFEERLAEAARRGPVAVARAAARELTDVAATAVRLHAGRRRRMGAGAAASVRAAPFGGELASSTLYRTSAMDLLRQDMSYAVRSWLRRPGFALIAMLTLALGIGANTSMFAVADAVVFRPLPHQDPDGLVMVWAVIPGLDWERAPISYPNYRDLRTQVRTLEDLAGYVNASATSVDAGAGPERVVRSQVTANLFGVLGDRPVAGRPLAESDGAPGAERTVVVGEAYARNRLGGVAMAVGRALSIGGEPHVVVGVMPASFAFPRSGVELWTPMREDAAAELERDLSFMQLIGRLAPGSAIADAERELLGAMERLAEAYPEANEGVRLWVEPRHAFVVGDVRGILLVLLGAVGLVLVIACANLANLMLARGATRGRELAIRGALGAGRSRIVRQLLTESALLGVAGGAVGAALAYASSGALLTLASPALPRGETIGVDGRALLYTGGVAVVCGLLVGVLPAIRFSGTRASLRERERSGTGGRSRNRLQRSLVVTQVALALILLVGAGLLVNSLSRLLSVDPGFRPEGALALHIEPPESRYPDAEQVGRFFDELIARTAALPGVEHVGAAWAVPFTGQWASGGAAPEGRQIDREEPPLIGMLPVRGDALGALGLRLVSGRWYTEADRAPDAGVVVVNETMARQFWPGEEAIGKRFRRGRAEEQRPWQTVIGVVADVKRSDLGAAPEAEAYFLNTHPEGQWARDLQLVVRTSGDPVALAAPIRRIVRDLDPELALGPIRTLPELVAQSFAEPRIRTLLASSFAGLAGLLAVVGIYGVMAFGVSERRREIGVRIALGARSRRVLGDVLRQGAVLTVLGLIIGLAGAMGASRLLSSVLFGVDPLDAPTYAAVTALLAGAALVACWIPARRASRVDPIVTLREE